MSYSAELTPNAVKPATESNPSAADDTSSSKKPAITSWKHELANATVPVTTLLEQLGLSDYIDQTDLKSDFRCLATQTYINKIQKGDFEDPLLKQILPLAKESESAIQQHGHLDPVGDLDATASKGLLHKYHGRALLISTGACAIHCRYCFRRHYPYQSASYSNKALTDILSYLEKHNEIEEVILSGGDPLVLDNEKLSNLFLALNNIQHIQTLRIHTRLPVILPGRIDHGLLQLFQASRFHIVMVIHANHANELRDAEQHSLLQLHQAGVTLLNQSVLLKGINDNGPALIALSKRLFQCKTLPYYLHSLDPVTGTMHFEVTTESALRLKAEMEQKLPGYLVPKLVQEIAGNLSKTAIFSI